MRGLFPKISDEELVLSALLGDIGAFDELVRRFRGAVIAVAEQMLGSREAAEDLAQEALLQAFKALPQLEDPAKFASWLYAITRRRAWRVGAQERRCRPTEASTLDRLLLAHSSELSVHPVQTLIEREARNEVRCALSGLPPDYRLVLQLHYIEDWTAIRIADFLALPLTTVKWRLHQGRKLLCRRLSDS